MTWATATASARKRAARRYELVRRVRDLVAAGWPPSGAVTAVAVDEQVTPATLARWVSRAGEANGPEALVDHPRTGRPVTAWGSDDAEWAWTVWSADYLRDAKAGAQACWERLRVVAEQRGVRIPSAKTFLRRARREVGARVIIRAREGRMAALTTVPAQERTTEGMLPLDCLSGDGWEVHTRAVIDGREIRPHIWVWQDVRTRRILGWRLGESESADLVRLAMADVCRAFGVPRGFVVDNTLAASSIWLMGDRRRRRKAKVTDKEPAVIGVFRSIGIPPKGIIHTTIDRDGQGRAKGRGRSKPVERCFQDLEETISRHPRLQGSFTGGSTVDKPESYDSRPAPWDVVLDVAREAIRAYNARSGRRMEAAAGDSCDEAWAREIAGVTPRRLTRAQEGILLLPAESTVIGRDGAFRLRAGRSRGVPSSRYHHPDLVARRGQRLVVRFDPANLHGDVEVYDARDRWLLAAECILPVGFQDRDAAAAHGRAVRREMRHLDRAAAAAVDQAALEAAYAGPAESEAEPEPEPLQKVVGMVPQAVETPAGGRRRRSIEDQFDRGLRKRFYGED